jgi:hypothetical protein
LKSEAFAPVILTELMLCGAVPVAELREAWEILDHTPLEVVDAGDVVAFLCKRRAGCARGRPGCP